MAAHAEDTHRLAELIVDLGANVQPGQLVGITTYPGKEALTRAVASAAYRRGARYVDVVTFDQWIKRERVLHATEESLGFVPPWIGERLLWLGEQRAARITLSGPHAPTSMEGVDAKRAGRDLLPYVKENNKVVNDATTNWTVVPAPCAPWAEAVYPDLEPDAALDRLWEAINHMCRLDVADTGAAWQTRIDELDAAADALTERRFDAIRLHGPGTDVTVGLFPSSSWHAAGFTNASGIHHLPNIPTEETFTTPDPMRVDGYVTATRPLELYGSIIEGIRVEFADGRAVKIDADTNADALRSAAERDEGAARLGELALVDGNGLIGPLDTVFLNTLIDENAVSHIALGSAYVLGVDDADDRERINRSQIHIDFMIGSPELDVDGITRDGAVVPVLRHGAWQI